MDQTCSVVGAAGCSLYGTAAVQSGDPLSTSLPPSGQSAGQELEWSELKSHTRIYPLWSSIIIHGNTILS